MIKKYIMPSMAKTIIMWSFLASAVVALLLGLMPKGDETVNAKLSGV